MVLVISNTASSLPTYFQYRIKEFILALPGRWASITNGEGLSLDHNGYLQHGNTVATLADDSVLMLQSIVNLFTQYIDRANGFLQQ